MMIDVDGAPVFVYTGGHVPEAGKPVVLLIHGAGHDHSVWNHQARHLAHHGHAVFAPDLPGHGGSGGGPIESIEALAEWTMAVLDALGVEQASLVGHSMGSLIVLQAAANFPTRIRKLVLIGSVAPMPVAPPLLDAALRDRAAAHAMINQWSYTPASQLGASASPGMRLATLNRRLLERQREGVLATDLAACNAYVGGLQAAVRVHCPVAMLCGARDQMTPARAARPLQEALSGAPGGARVIMIPASGHAMMAEAPDAVTNALTQYLTAN